MRVDTGYKTKSHANTFQRYGIIIFSTENRKSVSKISEEVTAFIRILNICFIMFQATRN